MTATATRCTSTLRRAATAAGLLTTVTVLTLAAPGRGAAEITPANVATLRLKWDFRLPSAATNGVTGSPVLANGLLYFGSWNGVVYALDPETARVVWSFDTRGGLIGVPSTVLVTPAGNVCFGDSLARVWCRDGLDGSVIWERSVGQVLIDAVWGGPATANGRLLVSVASLQDRPCTKGRLVALDLEDGHHLWTLQTIPDKVCNTDTGVVCTADAECPAGGRCVDGQGGGVTAAVSFDPTGEFVYMNTVGCYTFPSIGNSDSVFKIEAATGRVVWKTRVDPPEQFGFCTHDGAIDCGTDAPCLAGGGTCRLPKPNYHDFGFLNGPLPVDVDDGDGGTRTLLVSGSKNGTLYAFDEADGTIAWANAVRPKPVSPGFAGFGLFNGALAHAAGRIHAALYQMIPSRVCSNLPARGCSNDTQCGGGTCLPEPEHLMAFDAADGSVLWSDDIGPSWSHVAVAGGIVWAGTNDQAPDASSVLFAHDAATGERLAAYPLPATTASRATVRGGTVYVGYGIFGDGGGVRAFSLCGNGILDHGEACDDGNVASGDGCDVNCTATGCGNGIVTDDEACDPPGLPCAAGSPAGAFITCTDDCRCPGAPTSTTTTSTSTSSTSSRPPTTSTTSTTLPGTRCGDVTGDVRVDIADALAVAQFSVGLRACGEAPFVDPGRCDVNPAPIPGQPGSGPDGRCDIGDALRMAQCSVGLVDCAFACAPFAGDYASTWAAIQADVFDGNGCTNVLCHGAAPGAGGLALDAVVAYGNLVNVPAVLAPGLRRVEPGAPMRSFLWQKLAKAVSPDAHRDVPGTPMPPVGAPLSAGRLEAVARWIEGNAPESGVVDGTGRLLGRCLVPPGPQARTARHGAPPS